MTQPHDGPSGHDPGIERRRHPRFPVQDRLLGTLIASDLPVRIRDIGAGGFSVETMAPLRTGQVERVRFTAADDWSAVLDAQSLYCRPSVAQDGLPRFVTGYAFVADSKPDDRDAIATLIEKVTSVRMPGA